MGIWANQTIDQNTYLGWMSNAEGYNYFVTQVLPDLLTGSAKVLNPAGSNLGPVADVNTVIVATNASGAGLGLSIPQSVLEAAKNPPTPAPVATVVKPVVTSGSQALKDELDAWGLGSLADFAVGLKNQGLDDASIVAQIRTQDAWKTRFSGIVERQKKGLPTGSESDALAYEQSMHEMLGQYGITGYTQQDYQKWYGGDKSVAEESKRAAIASQWAYNEPPEARAAAARFGINEGDLTHFVFDQEHALPEIQKKLDAAQIAGSAATTGVGQLSQGQAMAIGSYTDPATAAGQLSKIAQQNPLYKGIGNEGKDFTLDDIIRGYFGGDQNILGALRARNQQRDFGQSGGGVSQSAKGAIGAGQVPAA